MKKNHDIDPSRVERFIKEEAALDAREEKAKARKAANQAYRSSTRAKMGVLSTGAVAIVVVVVVLLNILVKNLPENWTQIDLSGNKLYQVSQISKDYLSGLNYDIELLVVGEDGRVDKRVTKLLDNYAALSDRLTVTTVDPVKNPTILDTYPEIKSTTLVVKCDETGKYTTVPFQGTEESLIIYTYNDSAQTYVESAFDAEGQITSAIDYCVSASTETVYTTSGHEEKDLYPGVTDLLSKSNVAVSSVNLLTGGGIPADCSMLICYQPTQDLAKDELKMIREYMQKGGQVMVFIDRSDLPNFNALLNEYGLTLENGYIAETNTGSYYQQYFYVFAQVDGGSSSVPEKTSGEYMVLAPFAMGMLKTAPARDSIKVDSFLYSSTQGHLVTESETLDGSYLIAATAKETDENGSPAGKLVVYSCPYIISDTILDNFTNLDNQTVVLQSIITDFSGVNPINIPAKSLDFQYNTITNAGFFSVLFIAIIPLVLLVGGLMVWLKRRKL